MKTRSFFQILRQNADLPVAVGILGILLVIVVPLPPALVDPLLIANITFSVLILLATAFVRRPLELSVFPSLLLVVTFYRLSLNIATTRLILSNAADGPLAAGRVVEIFGGFIAGANPLVGLTIFTVIVMVQFVVITKGAGRVSEVAARFQLDSMPGKQLSVDGDLAGGLIDPRTARDRRAEIARQADFYGAMDGASKFVRGDAVAGMVIIAVNLLGGVTIGAFYHGLGLAEAVQVFSRLTIGDGLVNQVPALMVSVAAALLVTRSSTSEHLGRDLGRQLLSNDYVFFIASAFLLLLVPSGLPLVPLLLAALACSGCGLALRRERLLEESASRALAGAPLPASRRPAAPEARSLLRVEPLEVEFGYRLLPLIDESRGGDFPRRLGRIREQLALELGIVVPAVRVRDSRALASTEYSIKLRGNPLGRWRLMPEGLVAVARHGDASPLDAPPAWDPQGRCAFLVRDAGAAAAIEAGYELLEPSEFIAVHLETVVRSHAHELLTRQEVSRLLDDLRERCPHLVSEIVPGVVQPSEVQKVLQGLLREGVSIRDLEGILEALGDAAPRHVSATARVEEVRRGLARAICTRVAGKDGKLRAVVLAPALENLLETAAEEGAAAGLDPELAESIRRQALLSVPPGGGETVVLCSPAVRPRLGRGLAGLVPRIAVLSHAEVPEGVEVEVRGVVTAGRRAPLGAGRGGSVEAIEESREESREEVRLGRWTSS